MNQADLFDALAGSAMVVAMAILFGVCMWVDRDAAALMHDEPTDDALAPRDLFTGITMPRPMPVDLFIDDDIDARVRAICSAGSHTWQSVDECTTCGSTRRVPERLRSGATRR